MKRQGGMSVQRPWGSLIVIHSKSVLSTHTYVVKKHGRQPDTQTRWENMQEV